MRLTHLFSALLAAGLVAPFAVAEQKSLPSNPSHEMTDQEFDYLLGLCEGCHGAGGRSDRPDVPPLAGRDADYLFAQIEHFYFYERLCPDVPVDDDDAGKGHMSMCDVTTQMTKQEAQALAAHFEAQQPEG